MRQMWLEKKDTGEIWDCLPQNPYSTENGCFFANPTGLGYEQEITQKQVNVDYFIDKIKTANQEVIVSAYFNGVDHLKNFTDFIGDFEEQILLYYSPDGSIEPWDRISKPYYKPVVISKFERGEMNSAGFIVCNISFKSQSDVWRRDYSYSQSGITTTTAESLRYPYIYPYTFEGNNVLAIEIQNEGRETGCVVSFKNNSNTTITSNVGWNVIRNVVDRYGNSVEETQKAVFYVTLERNCTLYVDSNDTTQEAKVIYSDNTADSVVSLQEPSWDFINFVRLRHGVNRFVFNITNTSVDISIKYSELKEVI